MDSLPGNGSSGDSLLSDQRGVSREGEPWWLLPGHHHLPSWSVWTALPSAQKPARPERHTASWSWEYLLGSAVLTFCLSQHSVPYGWHQETKAPFLCPEDVPSRVGAVRCPECASEVKVCPLTEGTWSRSVMTTSKCWWPPAHDLRKMGMRAEDGVPGTLVSKAAAYEVVH